MTGERPCNTLRVMRGLDPRIHAFGCFKTWMAGTSGAKTALRAFCPAMTDERRVCPMLSVMRGLVPRIHVFGCFKTWMAGTSGAKTALRAFCPAMTDERFEDVDGRHKAGHDG